MDPIERTSLFLLGPIEWVPPEGDKIQVEPSQMGLIERGSLCFYWAHLSRFHLEMETQSSLQNVVFF
jgi:hypothetical protein